MQKQHRASGTVLFFLFIMGIALNCGTAVYL